MSTARVGLTKREAGEIAATAGKVRSVVKVEHLADKRQPPPLCKHKLPTQRGGAGSMNPAGETSS